MRIGKIALLFCLALAFLVFFWGGQALVKRFSDTGFSEDNVRAYARKYIESRPDNALWPKDLVIQDVKIQKMNLHDQELFIAEVNTRERGDFNTWATLYLVCSPDYSGYLISNNKYLLNDVDRDGYAQVSQQIEADKQRQPAPTPAPSPTSTVIYREYPAPTKAP
jgi:hypothetical protein